MSKQQLTLPFAIEGNTSSRANVRAIAKNADGLYKLHIDYIKIRPGFNARRKPDGMTEELWEQTLMISELADGIYASSGPADPILGDFYKVDDCFYQTDGERRIRAIRHLIRTGREIYPNGMLVTDVPIRCNAAGTTDLERKRKVISTQNNLKLRTMEKAWYYKSFKDEDGLTSEQIAELICVSRQTVDNYIKATELPKSVQEDIDNGVVKITNALADLRKSKHSGDEDDELAAPKKSDTDKKELSGDEDEFTQKDNSITFAGSMGGAGEDKSSGAIVLGQDSIYMKAKTTALWKQMINRMAVINENLANNLPLTNSIGEAMSPDELEIWREGELITRLNNEYNLTVK